MSRAKRVLIKDDALLTVENKQGWITNGIGDVEQIWPGLCRKRLCAGPAGAGDEDHLRSCTRSADSVDRSLNRGSPRSSSLREIMGFVPTRQEVRKNI